MFKNKKDTAFAVGAMTSALLLSVFPTQRAAADFGRPPRPVIVPAPPPHYVPAPPPIHHVPTPPPHYTPVPPPVHVPGPGRLYTPPPRNAEEDEADAANMMAQAIGNRGCDHAGEALRQLSNLLLANVRFATSAPTGQPAIPGDPRSQMREEMRRRWRDHLRSPRFWQIVWDRLAEAYRGCNRQCFDDGVAVGQISAAGYCSASVSVGGLNGPGFIAQPPLPLCQNATFTGCQVGYNQTASAYQGCAMYTSGGYTSVFEEFKSQDCHVDP